MNRIIPIRVASWMFSPLVWSTAGEFRRPVGFLRWSCRPQLLQLSVLPCGTYHRRFGFGAALSFPLCSFTVLNPFTPKNDQFQISPPASPVILHHIVWRTWFFIAYSNWRMNIVTILSTSIIHFGLKGWENVLFELGIERVKSANFTWSLTERCLNSLGWCTLIY